MLYDFEVEDFQQSTDLINPLKTNKKLCIHCEKLCELCAKINIHENNRTHGRSRLEIKTTYTHRS